jgi:hypothetical protein
MFSASAEFYDLLWRSNITHLHNHAAIQFEKKTGETGETREIFLAPVSPVSSVALKDKITA